MASEEQHGGTENPELPSESSPVEAQAPDVCHVCGKPVQTPLKCSVCKSIFHIACVTVSSGLLRKKKQYACPVCGHRSESYQLRMGE